MDPAQEKCFESIFFSKIAQKLAKFGENTFD